jgi:hypothetical protein
VPWPPQPFENAIAFHVQSSEAREIWLQNSGCAHRICRYLTVFTVLESNRVRSGVGESRELRFWEVCRFGRHICIGCPQQKNKSLVDDLKHWSENPRYRRLTSATVESLLRWTITSNTWNASVHYAYEVWTYLFGTPAPIWKNWNHGERRYEFDKEGWLKWFESLSGGRQ